MEKPQLRDSAGLWLAAAAVLAALSAVALYVGITERVSPASVWDNGWSRLGLIMAVLAVVSLFWTLVLFVANRHSKESAPPAAVQLAEAEHMRISTRVIRAEIATCRAMVEEAISDGHYPWSSYDHKLPSEQWATSSVLLGVSPNAGDAYHYAAMAYAEFTRTNRAVTEMATHQPQVLPEHRLEAVVKAAEAADHALIEFELTLRPPH